MGIDLYGLLCIVLNLLCLLEGIQFVLGITCLQALFKMGGRAKIKVVIWLVAHTFVLEILNLIGLITTILASYWYYNTVQDLTGRLCYLFGTINHELQPPPGSDASWDQVYHQIAQLKSQFTVVYMISIGVLGITSILTDALLVSIEGYIGDQPSYST